METLQKRLYKDMMVGGIVTVLIIAFALVGSMMYVAFFSQGLSIVQDVVIVLTILIVAIVVIAVLWMFWWMTYMDKHFSEKDWPKNWK